MAGQTANYLFDYPTSTDYVKDGATAIETLADDVDATLFTALGGAYPGLRLIKKQTVGSAVTSVTVTGAFSAAYEAYRIVVVGVDASAVAANTIKFGSANTNYYYSNYYDSYTGSATGTDRNNNTLGFIQCGIGSTADDSNVSFDVISPFLTKRTTVSGNYFGNVYTGFFGGTLADTTSYTAFTFGPLSGTFTGGTIYVYGYGAS
jgi:hypothetical protein